MDKALIFDSDITIEAEWLYAQINKLRIVAGLEAIANENIRAPLNVAFMIKARRWQDFSDEKLNFEKEESKILFEILIEKFNVDMKGTDFVNGQRKKAVLNTTEPSFTPDEIEKVSINKSLKPQIQIWMVLMVMLPLVCVFFALGFWFNN